MLAIQELSQSHAITIKPADKRGAVVIMDTEKYCGEIHRPLSDTTVYKQIDGDPVWSIKEKLSKILDRALKQGIIDPKIYPFFVWVYNPGP